MLCWEKSSTFCVQGIDIAPEAIEDIKKESLLLLKNYDEYNNFFWIED